MTPPISTNPKFQRLWDFLGKYNLDESDLIQISSIVTRKARTPEMLSLFSDNEIMQFFDSDDELFGRLLVKFTHCDDAISELIASSNNESSSKPVARKKPSEIKTTEELELELKIREFSHFSYYMALTSN